MRLPRIKVEFLGWDRDRLSPWMNCLESLGAQVDFKQVQSTNEAELSDNIDIAFFSIRGKQSMGVEFARFCRQLKASGVFVVLVYQSDKEIDDLQSLGVHPNWMIPKMCSETERLGLGLDIIDTVRFVKWSKNIKSLSR